MSSDPVLNVRIKLVKETPHLRAAASISTRDLLSKCLEFALKDSKLEEFAQTVRYDIMNSKNLLEGNFTEINNAKKEFEE